MTEDSIKRVKVDNAREALGREIEESGLIKKCVDFALQGEFTKIHEGECYTHVKWNNSYQGVSVRYEGGIFMMGGEEIIVSIEGEKDPVFHVVDEQVYNFGKSNYGGMPFIPINSKEGLHGNVCVLRYFPRGDWKYKIVATLEGVSQSEVERYKEKFGLVVE